MRRYISENLKNWLVKSDRKPIVLRGARQVGKTWIVRDFAKSVNLKLIELNFEREPELAELFKEKSPENVLISLERIKGTRINKTAKPVTLSHIYREIGNYRKMVNENSLYFACNFNPRVKVLKKGMFIPVIKNAGTIEFTKTTSTKDIKFLNDLDKQFRKNT